MQLNIKFTPTNQRQLVNTLYFLSNILEIPMKKIFYVLAGLTFCVAITHNAHALDITQAAAGEAVKLTVLNSPTFDSFNPSTSVIMDGVSQPSQFAVGSYHQQVFQKKSGKAFGMASDSSAVWWLDISADNAAVPAVATSDSTAFTATYTAM
jgi:hypothetical protein